MLTDPNEKQTLITEISKEIVAEIAPEEMELFDDLIADYFDHPTPPVHAARQGDDPLAFGLETLVIAVTPAVAAAISGVIAYLWQEAVATAKEESAAAIKDKIKALFHQESEGKVTLEPLTKEQLVMVKKVAQKEAETWGMQPQMAQQMAIELVGRLALKG